MKVSADGLSSDLHASAAYRANLIGVMTQRAVAKALFRNALMIGLAFGFAVNLSGLPLPGAVRAAVDMLADSALPAALFGLGGVLTRYAIRRGLVQP